MRLGRWVNGDNLPAVVLLLLPHLLFAFLLLIGYLLDWVGGALWRS